MNKKDKISLKKIVREEFKNRSDTIVSERSRVFFSRIKYIVLLFALFNLCLYLFPEIGNYFESKSDINRKTYLLAVSMLLLFYCWVYLASKKYSTEWKISREEWLSKTFKWFVIIHSLSMLMLTIVIHKAFPSNPIKDVTLIFVLISLIGFNSIILIIMSFPKLLFNQIFIGVGSFFFVIQKWSLIQLGVILILIGAYEIDLFPAFLTFGNDQTHTFMWILIIIIPALIELDSSYISNSEKINFTQKYILKFIQPKRVLQSLRTSKFIKKSELAALELYLNLEKEGNEYKQKALLIYLRKKHNSKKNRIIGVLIGLIIFVLSSLGDSIIQKYIFDPIISLIE